MALQTQRSRQATPERWQKALARAIDEGVQVRQLQGSGQWIATSGSQGDVAYELDVTGNVAHGCTCMAGLNSDPVCKHRAKFYESIGVLELEPESPAPSIAAQQAAGILNAFSQARQAA